MISLVDIHNFQSHQSSSIELHPGVNIFTGTTDAGKSSILRAIQWALYNRPRGADFRSSWALGRGEVTAVEIELSDGHSIGRIRTASKNLYLLDGEELKAFSTRIPDEVRDAVRMEDVNWQNQHDAPFMLSDTNAILSQRLNAIANLDIIDVVVSKCHTLQLRNAAELKSTETEITLTEQALGQYKTLSKDMEIAEQIRSKLAQLSTIQKLMDKLIDAIALYVNAANRLSKLPDVSNVNKELQNANQLFNKWKETCVKGKAIADPVRALRAIAKEEASLPAVLPLVKLTEIQDKINCLKSVLQEHYELRQTMSTLDSIEEKLAKARQDLKQKKAEFDKQFPDTCPLCGAPKNWSKR